MAVQPPRLLNALAGRNAKDTEMPVSPSASDPSALSGRCLLKLPRGETIWLSGITINRGALLGGWDYLGWGWG